MPKKKQNKIYIKCPNTNRTNTKQETKNRTNNRTKNATIWGLDASAWCSSASCMAVRPLELSALGSARCSSNKRPIPGDLWRMFLNLKNQTSKFVHPNIYHVLWFFFDVWCSLMLVCWCVLMCFESFWCVFGVLLDVYVLMCFWCLYNICLMFLGCCLLFLVWRFTNLEGFTTRHGGLHNILSYVDDRWMKFRETCKAPQGWLHSPMSMRKTIVLILGMIPKWKGNIFRNSREKKHEKPFWRDASVSLLVFLLVEQFEWRDNSHQGLHDSQPPPIRDCKILQVSDWKASLKISLPQVANLGSGSFVVQKRTQTSTQHGLHQRCLAHQIWTSGIHPTLHKKFLKRWVGGGCWRQGFSVGILDDFLDTNCHCLPKKRLR